MIFDCALHFQQLDNSTEGDKDKVIQEYQKRLRQAVNPRNLKLYVNSFLKYDPHAKILLPLLVHVQNRYKQTQFPGSQNLSITVSFLNKHFSTQVPKFNFE